MSDSEKWDPPSGHLLGWMNATIRKDVSWQLYQEQHSLWRMISERRSVKFMEKPRKSDDDVNVKMMRESDDDAEYECMMML
jgi:hypothetical protein